MILAADLLREFELLFRVHLIRQLQRAGIELRRKLYLLIGFLRDESRNKQAGVIVRIGCVERQLVLDDRTANFSTEIIVMREFVVPGDVPAVQKF